MEISDSEVQILREALYVQLNNFRLYNIKASKPMLDLFHDLNEDDCNQGMESYEDGEKLIDYLRKN